jgi:hypothetical protein
MKFFFQDDENYLCEKSSVNGFDPWDLGDSGNRIMQVMNGTPIAAVVFPNQTLLFVSSLSIRKVSLRISPMKNTVVHVDQWYSFPTAILAFQLSSAQNNPTWSTVPGYRGSNPEYPASISFASVCMLDGQGIVPVLMNRFEPDMETGWMDFATDANCKYMCCIPWISMTHSFLFIHTETLLQFLLFPYSCYSLAIIASDQLANSSPTNSHRIRRPPKIKRSPSTVQTPQSPPSSETSGTPTALQHLPLRTCLFTSSTPYHSLLTT